MFDCCSIHQWSVWRICKASRSVAASASAVALPCSNTQNQSLREIPQDTEQVYYNGSTPVIWSLKTDGTHLSIWTLISLVPSSVRGFVRLNDRSCEAFLARTLECSCERVLIRVRQAE